MNHLKAKSLKEVSLLSSQYFDKYWGLHSVNNLTENLL